MEEIKEIVDFVNKHPAKKHDEDHADLWNAILMCCKVFNEILDKLDGQDNTNKELWKSILEIWDLAKSNTLRIKENNEDTKKIWANMNKLLEQYPKITTMQKLWLLMDGENIIDTVNIESWRYLLIKNINPTDWNEFAKLDKPFSWEIVEVTNDEYDIKIDLATNTEWETATMTVNVDLLFIKF